MRRNGRSKRRDFLELIQSGPHLVRRSIILCAAFPRTPQRLMRVRAVVYSLIYRRAHSSQQKQLVKEKNNRVLNPNGTRRGHGCRTQQSAMPAKIATLAQKQIVLTRYQEAFNQAAKDAEDKRIDRTFQQLRLEEVAVRKERDQKAAAAQKKLGKKLFSSGIKIVYKDQATATEKRCDDLLDTVARQIEAGATEDDIRATKREYNLAVMEARRERAPLLYPKAKSDGSGTDLTPKQVEPVLTFQERYDRAMVASAQAERNKQIDAYCRQLRLEEARIMEEKARKTAKMTKALSKHLFMDGLVLEDAAEVRNMNAEVASLLEQLIRLEEKDDEDATRKMRVRYIEAVQQLRKVRAPHLYGGEAIATAPATPASESGSNTSTQLDKDEGTQEGLDEVEPPQSSVPGAGVMQTADLELQDDEVEEIQS